LLLLVVVVEAGVGAVVAVGVGAVGGTTGVAGALGLPFEVGAGLSLVIRVVVEGEGIQQQHV
jgi:hypothetical protein